MEETFTIYPVGDQAITFSFGNRIVTHHHQQILAIRNWLDRHPFPGILDVVVAYSSITVIFDLYQATPAIAGHTVFEFVSQQFREAYHHAIAYERPGKIFRIPVCYEAPFASDLGYIASRQGITPEAVISLHSERIYTIYMIGFLPGFPYMAEVHEKIIVPRKEKPSAKVEAGSVGIAGVQTGIYPLDSPGGWQIIGRTPLTLFDKDVIPPSKFEAGDRVQFYSITREVFDNFLHKTP